MCIRDSNTGINFGTYDWEHPSIRYFDPMYPVNMKTEGIRAWTKWNNTSGNLVTFGFTTNDEMQLFYYMYTLEPNNVGITEEFSLEQNVNVYPNPMDGEGVIEIKNLTASDVKISLLNIAGQKVADVAQQNNFSGTMLVSVAEQMQKVSNGVYFAVINIDNQLVTRKIVKAD